MRGHRAEGAVPSRLIRVRSATSVASFKRRPCRVPARSYFESKAEAKAKQPYFIHSPHTQLLLFAGFCESWRESKNAKPDLHVHDRHRRRLRLSIARSVQSTVVLLRCWSKPGFSEGVATKRPPTIYVSRQREHLNDEAAVCSPLRSRLWRARIPAAERGEYSPRSR
jgi:hypothetical protein